MDETEEIIRKTKVKEEDQYTQLEDKLKQLEYYKETMLDRIDQFLDEKFPNLNDHVDDDDENINMVNNTKTKS
jgi:hypothetical protein